MDVVSLIERHNGLITTMGQGKSGHLAALMASLLNSIGIPARYMSVSDAEHGELGGLGGDMVIVVSHSGHIPDGLTSPILITANPRHGVINYIVPSVNESTGTDLPLNRSLALHGAINDIISSLIKRTGFTNEQFKLNHPAGSIGLTR